VASLVLGQGRREVDGMLGCWPYHRDIIPVILCDATLRPPQITTVLEEEPTVFLRLPIVP
jgi:hypothetical protein